MRIGMRLQTTAKRAGLGALLSAALWCPGASQAADAAGWTAQDLMQTLAQNKTSRASFVERKYLAALDRPLESSGELIYVAPGRLEKRTVKPKPETLVIDQGTLTIERNGTRRSIALSSWPEVAAFTESIRATLAGDYASLSRDYRISVDGTREQWRLVLLPSDPAIATRVSRILVEGRRERIASIEILQAEGNRSVLTMGTAVPLNPPAPDTAAAPPR